MSIRTTTRLDTSPLDAFNQALDGFNALVEETMNETVEAYREPIKQRLREVPGPSHSPVIWTSEKQRRAYFATDGFGAGIPFKRTGALSAAWEVYAVTENGNASFVIINRSKASKFIYGGLGKFSNPAFKQAQHTTTGWLDAKPIVDIFVESMIAYFADTLRKNVQASISSKRRAYTGR